MASAREMRSRIRSVQSIAQVTRALEAVSVTKAHKAMAALETTRPYATSLQDLLFRLAASPDVPPHHPLWREPAKVEHILLILIGGDRGLAGAYNANVVRAARRHLAKQTVQAQCLVIGHKCAHLLHRQQLQVYQEFPAFADPPPLKYTVLFGQIALRAFRKGEADEVWLAYTEFTSLLRQQAVVRRLLPLSPGQGRGVSPARVGSYLYEPGVEAILDSLALRFVEVQIHQAILSSLASEHAARMVTMRNATDNAMALLASLRLEYNKARQQVITAELLDIAAGAEALRQRG